jgi:hypothetical protein
MRSHPRSRLAALALVAALLGACSSTSDDAASSDATAGGEEVASPQGGETADSADSAGGGGGIPAGVPLQTGRAIIATARIEVEVEDAVVSAREVVEVTSAAGGFLAQQEAHPADGVVSLTVRIPTVAFGEVLGRLEALGDVVAQTVDTEDVTEQVVDLESRIASARVSVARVRELLEGSGDVAQLATVEGELARREADLESLLGRQRVLDDQVALATIHLDLRAPGAVASDDEEPLPGFFGGLGRGWDGFITASSVAVTALGYALPFLVAALAIGGAWLWSARRRHGGAPSAAS